MRVFFGRLKTELFFPRIGSPLASSSSSNYKLSKGKKNASLVEFKLASNSNLRRNLEKQVEVYAEASQTERGIKVILYFSDAELEKVTGALRALKLEGREDIVLIDAGRDNKTPGSKT